MAQKTYKSDWSPILPEKLKWHKKKILLIQMQHAKAWVITRTTPIFKNEILYTKEVTMAYLCPVSETATLREICFLIKDTENHLSP